MKSSLQFFALLSMLVFIGCEPVAEPVFVEGMAPVYAEINDFSYIVSEPAREIVELGKIVNVGDRIYVNDLFIGIHVVDNSDPANPEFIRFLKIPGCTEFTVEGNTLYADNTKDLIVIDITDITNISVVNVIEDQYNQTAGTFLYVPPNYSGVFECVKPDEGVVIDWELRTLEDPACSTVN